MSQASDAMSVCISIDFNIGEPLLERSHAGVVRRGVITGIETEVLRDIIVLKAVKNEPCLIFTRVVMSTL